MRERLRYIVRSRGKRHEVCDHIYPDKAGHMFATRREARVHCKKLNDRERDVVTTLQEEASL